MSLKEQITEDMKSAMRAKETERLGTIRLLLAAIKQRAIGLNQDQVAAAIDVCVGEARNWADSRRGAVAIKEFDIVVRQKNDVGDQLARCDGGCQQADGHLLGDAALNQYGNVRL